MLNKFLKILICLHICTVYKSENEEEFYRQTNTIYIHKSLILPIPIIHIHPSIHVIGHDVKTKPRREGGHVNRVDLLAATSRQNEVNVVVDFFSFRWR